MENKISQQEFESFVERAADRKGFFIGFRYAIEKNEQPQITSLLCVKDPESSQGLFLGFYCDGTLSICDDKYVVKNICKFRSVGEMEAVFNLMFK